METTTDLPDVGREYRLTRVLTALACELWLIRPEIHKTLTEIAVAHAAKGTPEEQQQHAKAAAMPDNPARKAYPVVDGTAIIPFEGVIGRKYSTVLKDSGVVSIDIAERMIRAAAADADVQCIMLVFDSPGGIAMGVPEVAAAIQQARQSKPVMSYADGLMASAAYWMAAQADLVYAMPSADVGSIGVYMAILDRSRQAEMEGIRVEMFKSGKFKGMGYPGTSLNDEQRAMLQSRVDDLAAKFKAAVRTGRGRNISDDVMQGQSFSAEMALSHGLVDSLADFPTALRDAARLATLRGRK